MSNEEPESTQEPKEPANHDWLQTVSIREDEKSDVARRTETAAEGREE